MQRIAALVTVATATATATATAAIAVVVAACPAAPQPKPSEPPKPAEPAKKAPTPADAKAFVDKANVDLKKLYADAARSAWVKDNFITDDTDKIAAQVNEQQMLYTASSIKEAVQFNNVTGVDPDSARSLYLLRVSPDLPAPNDPKKTTELSEIAAKLGSMYGKAKYCRPPLPNEKVPKLDPAAPPDPTTKPGELCRDLEQLTDVMTKSRDYDELLDAWTGWQSTAKEMRPIYTRYVDLSNEGARDLGFKDVAEMWRGRYDMKPDEFEAEMERLWTQLSPLYQDLHCYVRGKLAQKYTGKVDEAKPIPAHLLGNMWSQDWSNVYELVEPYKGQGSLDVTAALKKKGKKELDLVHMAEGFFTSLGFDPLPKTFWERSLFLKPKDRDVVCHASAWDIAYDKKENDVRIKMCIKPDEDNLITLHHELGHVFYYESYNEKPVLFQQGANDGFHEAIGDTMARSVTPEYLTKMGVFDAVPPKNDKSLINEQMKAALEKVSFLPFGLLMDKWRWDVFSGKTPAADYNKHWWELRTKYQGIEPVSPRDEQLFDPGSKYHIPANVPYARYFLAAVLQFQFHKALCDAAGFKGPLTECSIYGNKEAGAKLKSALALGASKPWPEAMEALTGTKKMDAGPMLDYFAPLRTWLAEQNKGKKCGW